MASAAIEEDEVFSRISFLPLPWISPVCYRLNEISNKNVKTVHVIEKEHQFTNKLEKNDPEAFQQLEHLAANKCNLASQFRMTQLWISNEKSKEVLRNSLDLLRGCQLSFDANEQSANDKIVFLDECLGILESTKPVAITISQHDVPEPDGTFWLNPTVQKCSRVEFNMRNSEDHSDSNSIKTYLAISHWLHHRPMDCSCSAANPQVRCMIVWLADPCHIDWLLNRCSEDIQQALGPIDRRSFFGPECASFFHDFTVNRPIGHLRNDLKLKVGEQIFHLNKRLLEMVSSYFHRMFNNPNFMEASQDTVDTGETDAALFQDFLLAIIPTSHLELMQNKHIPCKNLAGLMRLADYYGVDSLMGKFELSLKLFREMAIGERIQLAKQYGSIELNEAILDWLNRICELPLKLIRVDDG